MQYIQKNIAKGNSLSNDLLNLGFWPGGDRDGNPFVTTEITLQVADRLRASILKCYYLDVRILKRKLTFSGVDTLVSELENKLYRSVFYSQGEIFITQKEFENYLVEIKKLLIDKHQNLYVDDVNALLQKFKVFGFHFASLDIRQNSKIHKQVFENIISKNHNLFGHDFNQLNENDKLKKLVTIKGNLNENDFEDEFTKRTITRHP